MGLVYSRKSPIKTDTIYREVAINSKTGLRTCHIDENTRFEIFEFWPSDLLNIFKKAGIQRHSPPFLNLIVHYLEIRVLTRILLLLKMELLM